MKVKAPPQLLLRFLEWFCPPALYEGIEGDLLEEYEADLKDKGKRKANLRLAFNVLKFFRPGIVLRNRVKMELINTIMVGNYIKVASRNIVKRKLYSFINAFGLSIAIAFCTLIYLFVQDEKNFDQFHENKADIYQLLTTQFDEKKFKEGEQDFYSSNPYMPAKLGEVLLDEFSAVLHMTRFNNYNQGVMRYEHKNFTQKFASVDTGFFKMFSFSILAGDRDKPLRKVSDAVLTPEVAKKYFGDDDPIGKTFTLDFDGRVFPMTVTAIIEAPAANSSLTYEMLVMMDALPWFLRSRENWGNSSFPTFVQLSPGADPQQLRVQLDTILNKYNGENKAHWREWLKPPEDVEPRIYTYQNLSDIHLAEGVYWDRNSSPMYSWILSGIAVLILAIACINYISLSLTSSASRRVEVGIRKVVGAQRKQIAWQFTFESLILALISMVIGLGLVVVFLPYFNDFTSKGIELTVVSMLPVIGVAFLIAVFVGLLAGSYPAIFLSGFLPALVLKGRFTSKLQAGFTKPLVVFQFFLSASMIICSVIMYRQMHFITTKDLGFDRAQTIVVPTQTGWNSKANQTVAAVRIALTGDPAVVSVSGVTSAFNKGWSRYGFKINGENKEAFVYGVDADYIPLLNIELKEGRNFDGRISDSLGVIVNEALVKDMKWTDPMSEHLNWQEDTVGLGSPVIGVMKDYHYMSLEHAVEPMFISLKNGMLTNILIKLTPENTAEKIEQVKKAWLELYPDRPFEYTFMDEDIASQYNKHTRWSTIMGLSTLFAILIACLGLFGLSGINAVNRTKEIGIRKVMGAKLSSIFILLNKQYVLYASLAFVLAVPLSWYAMNRWLDSFKFAITIGWEIFAFSILAGLLIAMLTVSYHAIKAALINPADTLKHE
jgi:putative ABC transport system permease protein